MILLLDNRDSFVHNLARYFRELGCETTVWRSDCATLDEIRELDPDLLVVSPGPGTPSDAGISSRALEELSPSIPVLGVCLGHHCIGEVFGARIGRALRPTHGRASEIFHRGEGVLQGLPSPFLAGRYHSLEIVRASLPATLEVTAWTEEDEIMAVRHRELPTWGVQYHPESILTEHGHQMLQNFLSLIE